MSPPPVSGRRVLIGLAAVAALATRLAAADLPADLLTSLSAHTLQGNVARPARNLADELKAWERALPKLSAGVAAEVARPLARRVLAAAMPKLLDAKPDDLIIAWGRVIGPALLKEIANYQTGAPTELNEAAVESLRQAVLKNQAARSAAAILRFQAEAEEAKFLTETVGPAIARAGRLTATDEKRVVCDVGNFGNDVWITVRNAGDKPLTNAVIGIALDVKKGGKRAFAFYTPALAAGETLRARTTLASNSDFAALVPADHFQFEKARLTVWSDRYVQKEQESAPLPVQVALKSFILSGFAAGSRYRSKPEYVQPRPPGYEFAVTGLLSGKTGHTITAVLTNEGSKRQWTGTATVTDKEFASLDPRRGQVTLQFRTKSGPFSMTYGLSGDLGGGPFGPQEGVRAFADKAAIDAIDAENARYQETPEAKAFDLFNRASTLDLRGQREEAKKLYAELIQKYPTSRDAAVARRNLDRLNGQKK